MSASNEISVGDLVIVVRAAPCCGDSSTLGNIFHVERVDMIRVQ
jgi:hypothetical protein